MSISFAKDCGDQRRRHESWAIYLQSYFARYLNQNIGPFNCSNARDIALVYVARRHRDSRANCSNYKWAKPKPHLCAKLAKNRGSLRLIHLLYYIIIYPRLVYVCLMQKCAFSLERRDFVRAIQSLKTEEGQYFMKVNYKIGDFQE